MCNQGCIDFAGRVLSANDVTRKRVIEVGSYDVNGTVRPTIEALRPMEYVGVDISPGPGVDLVIDAAQLLDRFAPGSFDVVVSTEMVEHVRDWRTVFGNLKLLCAAGGLVVVTTRSPGFPYHGFPHDYWRYELADMRAIFADFEIEALEADPKLKGPGVYIAARSRGAPMTDLRSIALFSMCTRDRQVDVSDFDVWKTRIRQAAKLAKHRVALFVRSHRRTSV